MDGIVFGESPRWRDGQLWVSDWGAGRIFSVAADGTPAVEVELASFPLCFDFLPDGRLLIVSSAERRLLRREPDASLLPHADLAPISTKPWNDIVVDARGNAYVNSIGFDFPGGDFAPGLVALVTSDGDVRRVADDLAFPNGMAVTPDGGTLIVAESYAARLTAFDIGPDGDLGNRRVWADLGEGAAPDGICVDAEGAVWFAEVPGRRCVRVAEGGEVLATHVADRGCFACMLGGPDGSTLFVVAAAWPLPADGTRTGRLLTVEAPAPAAGWPASS